MKTFRFVKKVFFIGLTILSSFTNGNSLSCVSMNNQECKTRSQVINVNEDEPLFFPFSIETSKCSGNCNNVFNLMSRTNETSYKEWHETCKCECKFGSNVCNNKLR